MSDQYNLAETYDQLPEEAVAEAAVAGLSIPSVAGALIHPYRYLSDSPGSGEWMVHCTNAGCGAYLDDQDVPPAADVLCEQCQAAGASEE